MSIPEKLYPTKMEHVSFWDLSVSDSPFAQSVATVHPNHYVGFLARDAATFARIAARAPEIVEAVRDFLLDHRNGLGPDPERLAEVIAGLEDA